ncbi:MAG: hypothetical protein ACOCW3_01410 [Spirochaetota bacterium]
MSTQPDFVSFDSRGRDELLSQIGSFSPTERELFHRLCDTWSPRIDAKRFIRSAEGSPEQEQTALERLMAKLRGAEIGYLTTTADSGEPEPDQIILTSAGSPDFWAALVDEVVREILAADFRVLPSQERMRERNALPPDYHVVEADSSQLAAAYAGGAQTGTIYRLRLMDEFRVVFTAATAKPLVLRAIQVLKRDLAERGVLEEVARIKDTSIMEIRQRLESKAPDVWHDLARTIVRERATIAFRKNFEENDEIFQLAYLVMVFVDARIGEARQQKESDEVVAEEIETLARRVREAPAGLMPQEEFSSLVDEAQTRLGAASTRFSRRLNDELLTPRPRRRLPAVLYIHGLYIHADRVRGSFEQAREEMSRRLTSEYTEIMEAFLRGRSPDIGEVFGSRERFNEDIARRVERQHPLLGEFLARPQLIAEAIIHEAKRKREGVSTEELKSVLTPYFDVDTSQLRPFNELFGLSLVAIFDDAFAQTSVFRQILLRLSGRHESLRATYTRRFGPRGATRLSYADERPAHRGTGGGREVSPPEDEVGIRSRGTGNRSHRAKTVSRRRHRPAPGPAKPKPKSREQIDRIWSEFDKALHTKPSEKDPS